MRRGAGAAAAWVVAAMVLTAGLTAGPALAAEGDTPPAEVGSSQVRVAHFSPDAPGVDVYIDGELVLGNVTYDTTSDYKAVPAGPHEVALRVTGSAPSVEPVLEAEAELVADRAYTIAGLGPVADLRAGIFEDDLSSPITGGAKVRVIHAAVGTGKLDVQATGGPQLASDLAFATAAPYAVVQPGRYGIAAADGDDGARLLSVPDVDFGSGIVYSLVVIGGAGQPYRILPIVDARGAEVLPAGALQTGGGGAAVSGASELAPWLMAGASAGVLLVGLVVAKRGRARVA